MNEKKHGGTLISNVFLFVFLVYFVKSKYLQSMIFRQKKSVLKESLKMSSDYTTPIQNGTTHIFYIVIVKISLFQEIELLLLNQEDRKTSGLLEYNYKSKFVCIYMLLFYLESFKVIRILCALVLIRSLHLSEKEFI